MHRFQFESVTAYADVVERMGWHGNEWSGGSMSGTLHAMRHGQTQYVAAAETMLQTLEARMPATEQREYLPSVCGAYPIVPEALIGLPQSMRRRHVEISDIAPLTIYIDLTSSGGVSNSDLIIRGTAALALAMRLTQSRPVDVYAIVALDRGALSVRLESRPLDLAIACTMLTHAGVARGAGYTYLEKHANAGGGWAFGITPSGSAGVLRYSKRMRELFAMQPQDVFLPPIFWNDPIARNPQAWIEEKLRAVEGLIEMD